jgi:hypothetical protein
MNKFKMVPEVVLLLPNTGHHEQVQDGTRGCSTSVKYWLPWTSSRLSQRLFYFCQILAPMNKFNIIPEIILLLLTPKLPNMFKVMYVTNYQPPWTSSRLYQRLFYCYQIRTAMNKIENMAKVALLLPNTDHHEQVQDYFKCCITSVSYALITFNKLVMVLMTYIPWLKRCLDSLISWLVCWLRYPHLLCGIWIQRTNIQIGSSWISIVVSCCPRMISSPMWKIQTKDYRMVIFASHYTCII